MADKRLPEIDAVEAVHSALLPLDTETRKRVLRSVYALLDITGADEVTVAFGGQAPHKQPLTSQSPTGTPSARPVSVVELIKEKQPGTNSQRIALFAYHREKHEGLPRFGREDLESYFSKAKETPSTNFDRDFVEAVKKGWIHEEGDESYITSRGIEAVEAGFAGERKYKQGHRVPSVKKTAKHSGKRGKAKPTDR